MTDFMESRGMEEDMAEDRHIFGVWEWMDGSWLYRSYIYIYVYTHTHLVAWVEHGHSPSRKQWRKLDYN